MARVLVIADDLTGANACAAGFARAGLRSVTVGVSGGWSAVAEFYPRFDVVVVTTDSRHSEPVEVEAGIRTAARAGWPVDLMACRVDTTMRGNVGVAANALIEQVRELSGERVIGLCQPAYPQAGRVTVQGKQLLYGKRLEDTELAHDVRSPMRTSDVRAILSRGTDLVSRLIPLDIVTGPVEELQRSLRACIDEDVDIVVADALTVDHIERVAKAAVAVEGTARWVTVDPGPASLAMAQAMEIQAETEVEPLLVISGSATELTQQQMHRLVTERDTLVVRPAYRDGSALPEVEATVRVLVDQIRIARQGQVILFATVLDRSDIRDLSVEEAQRYPRVLGKITRRVLQEVSVGGIYTTGGDITAAVLEEIGGQGIEIEDEVIPLAVAGEVVSGSWAGLPIVTKGGLIGDVDAALVCTDFLANAVAQRKRWVRSGTPRDKAVQ